MQQRTPSRVQDPQSPNLIPMIDVMFLLLLFFLLGADMAAREEEELVLAPADHAREHAREIDPNEPASTLNVHHASAEVTPCAVHEQGGACRTAAHWLWSLSGRAYDEATLALRLGELAALDPERPTEEHVGRVLSRRHVLIRADRDAPYGRVQKAIELCGRASLYKLAVAGALPAPR